MKVLYELCYNIIYLSVPWLHLGIMLSSCYDVITFRDPGRIFQKFTIKEIIFLAQSMSMNHKDF